MIAYKVVKIAGNKFYSAIQLAKRTEYKLNEKTIPHENCGPLCAFDSIEYARDFLKEFFFINLHIFECEIEKSQIDHIWGGTVEIYRIDELSVGTVLCDAITLLKEIT